MAQKLALVKCEKCGFPIDPTKKETSLKGILEGLTQSCKTNNLEVPRFYTEALTEKQQDKTLCHVCLTSDYLYTLLLKQVETNADPQLVIIITHALEATRYLFFEQQIDTALEESSVKAEKTTNGFLLVTWFAYRLKNPSGERSANLSDREKEFIRELRACEFSIRDMAFVLDRSTSTIDAAVKALKN